MKSAMKVAAISSDGRTGRTPPESPAFTLLELIVMVATLALLAAFLLPAIASTKREDKSAVCLSNLRQIGVGMAMYAAENDDTFHFRNIDSISPSIPNHGQWTANPRAMYLDLISVNHPNAY